MDALSAISMPGRIHHLTYYTSYMCNLSREVSDETTMLSALLISLTMLGSNPYNRTWQLVPVGPATVVTDSFCVSKSWQS